MSNPEHDQPLTGVRVLDMSEGVSGPFCAKILADYGASVVKVEPVTGDTARAAGPFPDDRPDPERSGLFAHLNANKRGMAVDFRSASGARMIAGLARWGDVVIHSWASGQSPAGMEPAELLQAHPQLVIGSITPFGLSGPYSSYVMTEIVAFAMGGPMNASGVPEREPVKLVGNAVLMQSGATAASAVLAALWHAQETGVGQIVDVANYETQNGSLDRRRYYLLAYQYSGYVTQRSPMVGSARVTVGGRYQARDGRSIATGLVWAPHMARMMSVIAKQDSELRALFEKFGDALLTTRPKQLNEAIAAWAATRTAREAMREAQAAGWPVVVVNDPLTLLSDEHLGERGFFVSGDSAFGPISYCGAPWRIDGGGWKFKSRAPRLGEHTEEILRTILELRPSEINALRTEGVIA